VFDIGFSELLLVAVVALLVLGPERLPGAVRTLGLWAGRLKRSFNAIRTEVEREIGADEIRRQLHNEQILQMERDLQRELAKATGRTVEADASAQPEAQTQPSAPAPAPAPAPVVQDATLAAQPEASEKRPNP
jgi:sec-independent protein translocase protein TatB